MNELTTEIIAALAQKQDLDEVFRHHLEIAINQLLQTELAEFSVSIRMSTISKLITRAFPAHQRLRSIGISRMASSRSFTTMIYP